MYWQNITAIAQITVLTFKYHLNNYPSDLEYFMEIADKIIEDAEFTEGFIWHLEKEKMVTTQPDNNKPKLVIMSLWKSIESLINFTYLSDHVDLIKKWSEWFELDDEPHYALWWVKDGYNNDIPTVDHGLKRLAYLSIHGSSPLAFTFKEKDKYRYYDGYVRNLEKNLENLEDLI